MRQGRESTTDRGEREDGSAKGWARRAAPSTVVLVERFVGALGASVGFGFVFYFLSAFVGFLSGLVGGFLCALLGCAAGFFGGVFGVVAGVFGVLLGAGVFGVVLGLGGGGEYADGAEEQESQGCKSCASFHGASVDIRGQANEARGDCG